MKLRARLSMLAAVSLIPMVVFSGIAANKLIDALRETALRGMRETANATALIIDREINGAMSAVNVLSTSMYIEQGAWKSFYDQAKVAAVEGSWIILYGEDGYQIVNTRIAFGDPLLRHPQPDEISQILAGGKPTVSGMLWSSALQRNFVLVNMPIKLKNGKQYVLSQAFFADYFNVAFADRRIPSTWVIGIFDQKAVTLARSHRAAEFVGKPPKPETVSAILNGRDTTLRHVIRGDVEVYDVITHSESTGWAVAVAVPVNEIDAEVQRATYIAGGGLLIALMLAVGVALLIGRRIAASIEQAAHSAVALGKQENIPAQIDSGIEELDDLQKAIANAANLLTDERKARRIAEDEKAELLESEQAARKLAESQNKAKDEFLAMLGHELRNPLSAITSATSLLELKNVNPAAAQRATAIIRRQSEHLRNLIDDLLDLGRVMSGKILLEKTAVDLSHIVANCIESLQAGGTTAGYDLVVNTQSALLNADPTRVEQIVTNLIDNAIKYTPAGGKISIDLHTIGHDAQLTISDSGIGIPPELLPHIFDVFVQGDNSLARAKGGLGIGLSLVQKLVELHGGTIEAESDGAGHGSRFIVRLPLIATIGNATPNKPQAVQAGAGYSILLVEDQEDGREMMTMLLQALGHRVLAASTGIDALEILNGEIDKPDVALVDIGLPGMDGYEVARRLRADRTTTRIKLIALTGYGLEEDRQRALSAGFDRHLTKPLKIEELNECLKTLLKK
jgi:signal transduction histidine kinase/ActR/RegA family two-component response regulator